MKSKTAFQQPQYLRNTWAAKAALMAMATLLVGCSHSSNYPKSWPALAEGQLNQDKCLDISGTYENAGKRWIEGHVGTFPSPYLSDYFFHDDKQAITASKINIQYNQEGNLSVEALLSDQVIASVDKERSVEFTCQDERIILSFAGSVTGAQEHRGHTTLFIAKAEDGSLVAEAYSTNAALFEFIPLGSSAAEWHQFAPAP